MVPFRKLSFVVVALFVSLQASRADDAKATIDFNRDIRPILSNKCYQCHGPDENERKGDLRLDTEAGSRAVIDDVMAVVPGKPDASEMIHRVTSTERSKVMPPPKSDKKLTAHEIQLLKTWIQQGGKYAAHWAYEKPLRPTLPAGSLPNPIDRFLLAKLQKEGLAFLPEADRYTLVRRVSLDLTGLPPTSKEVEEFVKDASPNAYEKLVDRLLAKPSYGEHWSRMWLDLARYADSAGYADDPARTIWAYRDYVIRSFNSNKPFDQFTIEQIAGDLLPNPTDEQLIATAFHRNTLTNNEGGTSDEEFRNVAVIDRVNTTLTTWMGTSIACAQCHTHKYDPITQKEFFQLYAFLNNSADADRTDETPLHSFYGDDQKKQRATIEAEIASIVAKWKSPTPEILKSLSAWEQTLALNPKWNELKPTSAKALSGNVTTVREDGSVFVAKATKKDTYTVELPLSASRLAGIRLVTLADKQLPGGGPGHGGGNFIVTRIAASLVPPKTTVPVARYIRITQPEKNTYVMLAEVQVFRGDTNIATKGTATQISTAFDGLAKLAIDGNTNGEYFLGKSVSHTAIANEPWWEVDLGSEQPIDRIAIWNRTDGGVGVRMKGAKISALDAKRNAVWEKTIADVPNPSTNYELGGAKLIQLTNAVADFSQPGFDAILAIDTLSTTGWAVGGAIGTDHALSVYPPSAIDVPAGSKLVVTIEQQSTQVDHVLGRFRIAVTDEPKAIVTAKLPERILKVLNVEAAKRTPVQREELATFYATSLASETMPDRVRATTLSQSLAAIKPTTVPIMQELPKEQRRKTKLQFRGNYQDLGEECNEGVPSSLHAIPKETTKNRLALAKWLVDRNNPLTARVIVNRDWEQIFGVGLVRTSEEFGSQGELPSHPELLDWLAVELMEPSASGGKPWDRKALIKLLVTTTAYKQTSKVTPDLIERDPENRWVGRGPRVRLTAEMVRDQALAVSGLLSAKMYGPSVKPPQPSFGLSAAFGRTMDWSTSDGEDKFRRGIYTEWRRTNPYPSMATFDAPNRDICSVRRPRTNTPLQALVTLNDSVYIEAAQAFARNIVKVGGKTTEEKLAFAFREALSRPIQPNETARLTKLYESAKAEFAKAPDKAKKMATEPIGPAPPGVEVADLAAWTVVANVMLNLDETLMKR